MWQLWEVIDLSLGTEIPLLSLLLQHNSACLQPRILGALHLMPYPRQPANPQHSQVYLSGRDHKISASLKETAASNRHRVHEWVCPCIQSTLSHPVEEMGWKQQAWDQAWIMTLHRGEASEKHLHPCISAMAAQLKQREDHLLDYSTVICCLMFVHRSVQWKCLYRASWGKKVV